MKIRNLTEKEFNHLRISNIEEFLESYPNNRDSYSPPFKIFADLENQVKFENYPGDVILCDYKPGGYVIFRLVEIKEVDRLRIVVFQYESFVS